LLVGRYLGGGVARKTFVCALDPQWVVKVEYNTHDFQNIAEWHLWSFSTEALRQWLAPCWCISPNGRILIQKRCEPITRDRLPKKVPGVLDDLHEGNWGWLDGRPVALDYGYNLAVEIASNMKMKKAEW
jgi:hypothetical protein